jgi:hypothetical protein
MGTGDRSVKLTNHLHLPVNVENAWSYTSVLLYVFMAWRVLLLGKPMHGWEADVVNLVEVKADVWTGLNWLKSRFNGELS